MSQWYLSKNGQALGPLEEDKVIALIQEGDLAPVDLVYQAGATEWLPISQVETFAQHFKKNQDETVPYAADKEPQDWVVLKKVDGEKGKEFKQLGPFSEPQILSMIDTGEVRFSDFAWKQFMDSWVKIGEIPEFSKPLPSTPPIDTSIYEKNHAGDDFEETVVDEEQKASLTELVSIEHFDHQKTMVQPRRQVEEPSAADAKTRVVPKSDSAEDSLYQEISEVTPIPINEESFVTDSGITDVGAGEDEVNVWSLDPPGKKKVKPNAEKDADEATSILPDAPVAEQDLKPSKAKKAKPKRKPKKKKSKEVSGEPLRLPHLSTESLQWFGVVVAVIFAVIFFYKSFQIPNSDIVYDSTADFTEEPLDSGQPFRPAEIEEKTDDYQQELQSARQAQPAPGSFSGTRLSKEVVRKIEPVPPPSIGSQEPQALKKSAPQVAKSYPSVAKKPTPKTVQEQRRVPPPPKVVEQKTPVQVSSQDDAKRRVAAKSKKLLKDRAKIMGTGKKKRVAPKPKANPKKRAQKPQSSQRPAGAVVAVAAGGAKAESFYKQRDRLALFYSSLNGERLAVEIAKEYRKLKNSPRAWTAYYGQWRKKVRASLAKDIQEFPKPQEQYAYPKVLASFKKDYDLFYKYGEGFNAKVKGARVPSGVPSDMKQVFTRYKKQAQKLGL